MALRATEEPRLIRLMTMPKRKETMTALRGMGKFGETCGVVIGRLDRAVVNWVLCCILVETKRYWRRRDGTCTKSWKALESMRTFDRNGENGKPLSRANDQICREAVATSAITAHTRAMIMIAVMMLVPT